MKKLSVIILAIVLSNTVFAQLIGWPPKIKKPVPDNRIQTVINPGATFGFYLAMDAGTQLKKDQPYVKIGGSGAFIINDRIGLGAAGYAYSNDVVLNPVIGQYTFSEGSYMGFLLEPMFFSNERVHFTLPTIIGGGSSATYELDPDRYQTVQRIGRDNFYERHNYLLVEPGINLELNLTRFMRMGVKASYMVTTDVRKNIANVPKMDGLQMNMNLRVGWF